MSVSLRLLTQTDYISQRALLHQNMIVSRRNIDMSAFNLVFILSFRYGQRTDFIQTFCKFLCKARRHVLNNQNRLFQMRVNHLKHIPQGIRATRRNTQGNNFYRSAFPQRSDNSRLLFCGSEYRLKAYALS